MNKKMEKGGVNVKQSVTPTSNNSKHSNHLNRSYKLAEEFSYDIPDNGIANRTPIQNRNVAHNLFDRLYMVNLIITLILNRMLIYEKIKSFKSKWITKTCN